jgi:palmitoyltransferase
LLQEASNFLFAVCVLLTFYLSNSDPGYVKPLNDDPDLFFKLLITYDPESLCPDCQIMKTARCRHCNFCDRCIERFDHHCPWINNCVGEENFKLFYLFVVLQLLYLSIQQFILIKYLYTFPSSGLWYIFLLIIILCFFVLSLSLLCYVQSINLLTGYTTCERYTKGGHRRSSFNTENQYGHDG